MKAYMNGPWSFPCITPSPLDIRATKAVRLRSLPCHLGINTFGELEASQSPPGLPVPHSPSLTLCPTQSLMQPINAMT